MDRKWLAAILIAVWLVATISSFPEPGFSLSCDTSLCSVTATASPIALAVSALLAGFVLSYPQQAAVVIDGPPVSVVRQIGALFIDTSAIMLIAFPAATLVMLAIEAAEVGVFAWSFQRTFLRMTDFWSLASLLIFLAVLVLYFQWHGARGRRTLGEYVLGYRVTPAGETPSDAWTYAWRRVGGIFLWPLTALAAAQHPDKTMWWDRASGFRAVRVA